MPSPPLRCLQKLQKMDPHSLGGPQRIRRSSPAQFASGCSWRSLKLVQDMFIIAYLYIIIMKIDINHIYDVMQLE